MCERSTGKFFQFVFFMVSGYVLPDVPYFGPAKAGFGTPVRGSSGELKRWVGRGGGVGVFCVPFCTCTRMRPVFAYFYRFYLFLKFAQLQNHLPSLPSHPIWRS